MIPIAILDSHRARAVEILRDLPVWKGSHRGEAANQVGVLGEDSVGAVMMDRLQFDNA